MRILDRYVLWGFVANYLICFFVLVGLYIVLDAFERWETLKEYQEAMKKRAEEGAEVRVDERPLPVALAVYYLYNIPVIFVQVAPAITLMAAMFTMTRMVRAGEIVPLKASGVSLYRVIAPIVGIALVLAFASVAVQEALVPKYARKLVELEQSRSGDTPQLNAVVLQDEAGTVYFCTRFYPIEESVDDLRVLQRHPAPSQRVRRVITAKKAVWRGSGSESHLVLSNGSVDEFDPQTGRRLEGFPKLFGNDGLLFPTRITPADILVTDQRFLLSLQSLAELRREAKLHPGIAPVQVEIASRFTRPLAHVLLLFLGLPFVLGKETKNFFLGAGFAMLAGGGYFVITLYCTKLGNQTHIHPLAAAWLPVIVFGSLGACLTDMIQT